MPKRPPTPQQEELLARLAKIKGEDITALPKFHFPPPPPDVLARFPSFSVWWTEYQNSMEKWREELNKFFFPT